MDRNRETREQEYQAERLYSEKKYEKAALKYMKSITFHPTSAAAIKYNNLGYCLYEAGKKDQALAKYKISVIIDPKFTRPYFNIINVFKDQKRYLEAESLCEKLAEKDIPGKPGIIREWGLILECQEKYEQACSKYSQMIELVPNNTFLYNDLGAVLQKQGKFDEAKEIYKKIISIDPHDDVAYNNLGLILYHQQKYEEALLQFNKANKIDSSHLDTYVNVGLVYFQQGKKEEAIQQFLKGIEKIDLSEKKESCELLEKEINDTEKTLLKTNNEAEIRHLKVTLEGMKQIKTLLEQLDLEV